MGHGPGEIQSVVLIQPISPVCSAPDGKSETKLILHSYTTIDGRRVDPGRMRFVAIAGRGECVRSSGRRDEDQPSSEKSSSVTPAASASAGQSLKKSWSLLRPPCWYKSLALTGPPESCSSKPPGLVRIPAEFRLDIATPSQSNYGCRSKSWEV